MLLLAPLRACRKATVPLVLKSPEFGGYVNPRKEEVSVVHLTVRSMHGVQCQLERKPSQIKDLATLTCRLTAPSVRLSDYFKWWSWGQPLRACSYRPCTRGTLASSSRMRLGPLGWVDKKPGPAPPPADAIFCHKLTLACGR
jgi:hypothetical protein